MSNKELKEAAQDAVLSAAMNVMYREDLSEDVLVEARKQLARIEKLFRYEPNSWAA